MKKFALLPVLIFLSANLVSALDFGLLFDNDFEAENKMFSYNPGLAPWFSWDGGKGIEVYISADFSLKYYKYGDNSGETGLRKPGFLFELTRSAFIYRSGQGFSVEAGRILYSDAMGVNAIGLFDGARIEKSFAGGDLSAALLYTGLLYRENAKIVMTGTDAIEYIKPYKSAGDYFASRRLFITARWDNPLLEHHDFSVEALFQFDLNGKDDTLHSQYAQAMLEFFTENRIGFSAGALLETMEGSDGFALGFGAKAVLRIDPPTSLNDSLRFTAKYSSGAWNETFASFTPITALEQGYVFAGTFSGLSLLRANYDVRIMRELFAEASLGYFMRTYSTSGSKYFYGGEFWASLAWQPLDDIRAYFGFGMFFPGMGNIYPTGTDALWKINAGLSLSF